MHPRTLILTAALLTRSGRGGVAGDVAVAWGVDMAWDVAGAWGVDMAWDVAGAWGVAGVGLHLTGTRGGRPTKQMFFIGGEICLTDLAEVEVRDAVSKAEWASASAVALLPGPM